MNGYSLSKPFLLAALFIKEQLKEPVALFWMVVSPAVTFYLIAYARTSNDDRTISYLAVTSWFYAFIACSVAFFGLAFYIVGRRESGFLRSFVYTTPTKLIFLFGQFFAYSILSIVYCVVFYGLTKFYFGSGVEVLDMLDIVLRFYICFLLFSIFSLLLTLAPLSFQNASTVFSVLVCLMLALGIVSASSSHTALQLIKLLNPMGWANQIMVEGVAGSIDVVLAVMAAFSISFGVTFRLLLINPVWSRY
ncbi:ABC transporter permease [Pseudomonas reactans]|uniref:ABC transporter permease n=1 Tax=Pseudomonas reactans TaxID=117680 RepID=A0ABX2R4Y8_9PSED|nr:ABC transporter permease [Pseudomonas reactans]NWA42108.1 ABC transporter permease [Pseudomonas reactans]NWD99146.1 ABC transporter permease [Pseudomonas reactans]